MQYGEQAPRGQSGAERYVMSLSQMDEGIARAEQGSPNGGWAEYATTLRVVEGSTTLRVVWISRP